MFLFSHRTIRGPDRGAGSGGITKAVSGLGRGERLECVEPPCGLDLPSRYDLPQAETGLSGGSRRTSDLAPLGALPDNRWLREERVQSMVSIRRYAQADRESLRGLVLELHETLRPMDSDLAPGDQIIERHFEGLMSYVTQTNGAIFVADDDGRLIGYVCVFGAVTPDEVDERPDSYSFIAELFVRSEYRGLAIGRELIERAEHHAAARGSYKLELKVLAQNESAMRFYESLGYAPRVIVMRKRNEAVAGDPEF